MALMARKCGIMDSRMYSAPAMYSYFTHPAVVDNFMLLSPQLAQPANQCPLTWLECSYVTGSSFHKFFLCTDLILFHWQRPKQYNYRAHCECAPGGCYRQMLITVTRWPPVASPYSDNELDHLCCVLVTGHFLNFYVSGRRFTEPSYCFLAGLYVRLIKFHSFTPERCSWWPQAFTLSSITWVTVASTRRQWFTL